MSKQGPLYDQLAMVHRMATMHGLHGAAAFVLAEMERLELEAELRRPIEGQEELPL